MIKGAKTFSGFYQLFLNPSVLPVVNFINEWGLALLGVSLVFGMVVRLSSALGVILTLLYYFPVLEFPFIKPFSFLIDDHIIFALILILFIYWRPGRIWGVDAYCGAWPVCRRFPQLHRWLS